MTHLDAQAAPVAINRPAPGVRPVRWAAFRWNLPRHESVGLSERAGICCPQAGERG